MKITVINGTEKKGVTYRLKEIFLQQFKNDSEINEFCLALPKYKRPRKIIFADVPRNPTGKIEKPKLREIYCKGRLVVH